MLPTQRFFGVKPAVLIGLNPSLLEPLARTTSADSAHAGIVLNGQTKSQWRWTVTGNADLDRSLTHTERDNSTFPRDRTRETTEAADLKATANGKLFKLPAGDATTTLTLGGNTQHLDASRTRLGAASSSSLSRTTGDAAINFDLPISRRNRDFGALGNLTLNGNAEADHLSDFGTLTTIGAGLNWSPVDRLNFIASWTREEGAPTINQLGDPVLDTPASRIFDFTTGQTVLDFTYDDPWYPTTDGQGPSLVAVDPTGPTADLSTAAGWRASAVINGTPGTADPTEIPAVTSVQVNDGSAQRSRVTGLQVTFNAQVSFATTPAAAFTLVRNSDGAAVSFTATAGVVGGVTVATLNNFGGSATQFGSLADGRYTLTALAGQISAGGQQLDGNGDGTAGDNFTFGDAQSLFRFYGDANGDRHVDIADFAIFSNSFNSSTGQSNYLAYLDYNGDGHIDIADFGQFSIRFFTPLP